MQRVIKPKVDGSFAAKLIFPEKLGPRREGRKKGSNCILPGTAKFFGGKNLPHCHRFFENGFPYCQLASGPWLLLQKSQSGML